MTQTTPRAIGVICVIAFASAPSADQGGYIMGVRNNGTEETSTGFYLRNAFGKMESGSTAASSMETHTGLGFAGAGTPTAAGGGYVYMRNRWYDPQTGRFLSQDPIGLAGGVNLYAYAGNNPSSYSDPFGLCKEPSDADCPNLGQQVADRITGFFNSMAGRAVTAMAEAVTAIASTLESVVPGVGNGAAAATGIGPDGEKLSSGERALALAGALTEVAAAGVADGAASKLTNAQAADLARYVGYERKVKGAPINSMGQAVFSNGKTFITQDVTSHSGGMWKMFDRRGKR